MMIRNEATCTRRVHFSDALETGIPPNSLSDEEKLSSFYSRDELREIRQNAIAICTSDLEEMDDDEYDNICWRGLEDILKESQKRSHVRSVVSRVVDLDREQRENGASHPEELCQVYMQLSGKDLKRAVRVGLQDQGAVRPKGRAHSSYVMPSVSSSSVSSSTSSTVSSSTVSSSTSSSLRKERASTWIGSRPGVNALRQSVSKGFHFLRRNKKTHPVIPPHRSSVHNSFPLKVG